MVNEQAYYSEGVKKSVYETHSWRTVENSMAFVIPLIKPDSKILDVGSGPGTITVDYGRYVPQGSVIGVEPTQELIDVANEKKESGTNPANVSFQLGSIYELPFEDNTFDLVVAHQVILHLEDPVSALKELRRVTKPNGYVGVKDADLKSRIVFPESYEAIYQKFIERRQAAGRSTDPIAGRRLKEKALKAGYAPESIKYTNSTWTLSSEADKKTWAKMFMNRLADNGDKFSEDDAQHEEFKKQSLATWKSWLAEEAGIMSLVHGELVHRK